MKIALIRKEFVGTQGGAEHYAVGLAEGLAARGHSVHVFAGRQRGELKPGMVLHCIPHRAFPSALKNLSFQRSARRALAGGDFDIVSGLSQVYPQDVYRLGDGLHRHWLSIQPGRPVERLLRRLSPRHLVILKIEKEIFRPGNYRRIIANSRMCEEQLKRYYGVPADRIITIINGVDLQRFHPEIQSRRRSETRQRLGLGEREIVMLFAGHNFKRKGLGQAVRCAAGLAERGSPVRLVVAGRGRPKRFLKLAEGLGCRSAPVFTGPVENMAGLYGAADLLIHPALYDPFSNVCLEAMACGLPVVTTRGNGASEIIEHRRSGIILGSPDDAEAMTEEISQLLANGRDGLTAMGVQARRSALEYPVERNTTETLAVFQTVAEEKGRA